MHYLRWSKTVRWNRPGGTFARIVVLPDPRLDRPRSSCRPEFDSRAGSGLAGMVACDALAAALICRRDWLSASESGPLGLPASSGASAGRSSG